MTGEMKQELHLTFSIMDTTTVCISALWVHLGSAEVRHVNLNTCHTTRSWSERAKAKPRLAELSSFIPNTQNRWWN